MHVMTGRTVYNCRSVDKGIGLVDIRMTDKTNINRGLYHFINTPVTDNTLIAFTPT
jgi:hypothetical protein